MQFVDPDLINDLFGEAETSQRKRAFHTFHQEDDMFNRVLIAGTTGSYAAPHRHTEKFEAFAHIEGGLIVVEFDNDGTLLNAYDLEQCPYVEFGPMTWHSVIYTTERWVLMELALWKTKYDPGDKEFAPWAPKEGDPDAADYLRELTAAATALAKNNA